MAAMLKSLLIWPDSGWTDVRWCPPHGEADPEWPLLAMDALLRGSKKVSERLSTCLAEQGIEMPRSEIRLMARGLSASGDLEVEIYDYTRDGPYVGSVRVPIGFHDLDVRRRDELVLQMWRETLTQIVACSGKDPAAVERAADAARRDDYEVPRHGPWKQDRSRSRRVRLVGGLHDDGFLHLHLEIEELRGFRETRLSDGMIDSTLGWSFDKAAKSVRWESSHVDEGVPTVSVVIEGGGRFELDGESGSIRVIGGFEEPWKIAPTAPAVPTGFRLVKKPDDHIDVLWGSAGDGFGAVPKEYEG
ncbi:hypothetical protein C5B94_09115 [Clavibacter michiganensis]|nr:hypothetical protein C5B94_09115 [Clavibacter michiganensis]